MFDEINAQTVMIAGVTVSTLIPLAIFGYRRLKAMRADHEKQKETHPLVHVVEEHNNNVLSSVSRILCCLGERREEVQAQTNESRNDQPTNAQGEMSQKKGWKIPLPSFSDGFSKIVDYFGGRGSELSQSQEAILSHLEQIVERQEQVVAQLEEARGNVITARESLENDIAKKQKQVIAQLARSFGNEIAARERLEDVYRAHGCPIELRRENARQLEAMKTRSSEIDDEAYGGSDAEVPNTSSTEHAYAMINSLEGKTVENETNAAVVMHDVEDSVRFVEHKIASTSRTISAMR